MAQFYAVKNGKLVSCIIREKSYIPYVFLFLLALGCGLGAYIYAMKKFAIPQDSMVLTTSEYEHLKSIEEEFARSLENDIKKQEYVLSREQLKQVFQHAFPEVRLDKDVEDQYLEAVDTWSAHYSMPPLLVLSIIWRESFFNAKTLSSANARGPMQVIYIYHKEKLDSINKGELDLHDINIGVRVGVQVLREYFDRYDRNIFRAMQAYVGGEHKTYARDILTRYFNARIYMEEQL